MTTQLDDIDKKRTTEKLWKQKQKQKIKMTEYKKQQAFSHTGGKHYKSGAFHAS